MSTKTIKGLGGRENLRNAFMDRVIPALAEYEWILFELNSGGYGAVQAKALEAAKTVTAKRLLTDDERTALRRGTVTADDFTAYEEEAAPEQDEPEEEE